MRRSPILKCSNGIACWTKLSPFSILKRGTVFEAFLHKIGVKGIQYRLGLGRGIPYRYWKPLILVGIWRRYNGWLPIRQVLVFTGWTIGRRGRNLSRTPYLPR